MENDIASSVLRFFAAVDNRDWEKAEALMTTPFFLDYASFGAGPGAELTPSEILTGWQGMLPGFDATHHQLGPLDIQSDGDAAVVNAYVTASHQIADAEGGALWTVYGSYDLKLVKANGWKLSATTFRFKFLTGNVDLPKIAAARVAAISTQS